MINSQNLIDKVCARIACGGMTDLETCQTTGALNILSNPIVSVATFSALPSAFQHEGRMIYVNDENRYYHATGGFWLSRFDSNIFNYANLIFAGGANSYGQLGDGTTISKSSPVSIIGGFTDWCRISVGSRQSIGLRQNGTLWSWGNASLGDGTTNIRSSPVSVIGGFTDWCQFDAACTHSVAVRTNGTLWGWGINSYGQLGDNSTTHRSSPVSVIGGFTDWCQASAGVQHSLGIRTNGSLWAWGRNNNFQLGTGNNTVRSSPVSVIGGFTDWCQVSAGFGNTFAIRTGGTLWAWGQGNYGQLGDGTATGKCSPVSVVGGFTDWCQVSVHSNGFHTHAIRTNGTLWAWGSASLGRIGVGDNSNRCSPTIVAGGFTDWCQVSAGAVHSIAVRQNGTAWAWGFNSSGRLMIGSSIGSTASPITIAGGFTDWCQVEAGYLHSLGLRSLKKGF